MTENKFVYGEYDDEHILLDAIRKIRKDGTDISEVYSPFAVHGMEDALGLRMTRIPIAAFLLGMTGGICMFAFMAWIFGINWPINIGGKPFIPLPAFVPPLFEFTVLTTGVSLFVLLFHTCKLLPSVDVHPISTDLTDDKFVIEMKITKEMTIQKIETILKGVGANILKTKKDKKTKEEETKELEA
ncbi:MAG: DUF3341 domain-containing protein [Bacteroidetes bacterium]|nr:DUF3341 domain-containing protein [Bacteroidota bacterium]